MTSPHWLRSLLFVLLCWISLPSAWAACTVTSYDVTLGEESSFAVASGLSAVGTSSEVSCDGQIWAVLTTNTVEASIPTTNTLVMSDSSGNEIPYVLCTSSSCNTTYGSGSSLSFSSLSWGIFSSGSSADLPLYIKPTSANVPSGTYTGTLTITWSWKICTSGLGLCLSWTTGSITSVVTVDLLVTNECAIASAPDVDFGTAASPASFSTVSSSLGVRCTLAADYSVNLTSANGESSGWRQMAATVDGTTYYLQYRFYHSDNTAWTSDSSDDYSTTGTGLAQSISFTAGTNSSQGTLPAGSYSDTVTVTVSY